MELSVIGMLLYLAGNTRPDLSYAVHQAARFSHDSKKEHGEAVKRTGCYIKGTAEQGIHLKAGAKLTLDAYADASFAGLWNVENAEDPISVKSRTATCPSSSRPLLIAQINQPADALPLSSHEASDATSMSLPLRIRCIISLNPSLSSGKSLSIRWKVCCCIWSSATTWCIFAWTNASNAMYEYGCILGLMICASLLIFCSVSTSGRLLCSATSMIPRF